ncbi:MAG: cytochrome c oxidase subunit II [Bacteriovoracaceae bacterium]
MKIFTANPSILWEIGGPHAREVAGLFHYFFVVESIVFVLVLGFLFWSIRKNRRSTLEKPFEPSAATEKKGLIGVSINVLLTIFILTSFVAVSYVVDNRLLKMEKDPELEIEVTAHQWWWELRYQDKNPSKIFTTANEIHVPVKKKIRFILSSSDVVHSFWVPNIAGKKDIIPGRDQDLVITVDKPGVYHGRCAEFCGNQHAYMGIVLIAESEKDFEEWREHQRKPAMTPVTAEEKHGEEIFQGSACMMCHTLRTEEQGSLSMNAPDLTHLKSRTTIGAGAAPNMKGYLGGWIIDPHSMKPGVHMPTNLQRPEDFQALLTYLESLK